MRKTVLVVSLVMTLFSVSAKAEPVTCSVELGVEGACTGFWDGPYCPFTPKGVAIVQLDFNGIRGSGNVSFEGQNYPLECKPDDLKTGDFSCSAPGTFRIYGSPGIGITVFFDSDNLTGQSQGCV